MADAVTFYKKNWWLFLLEGIAAIIFGIIAVANPANTLATLGFYFGLLLLIAGAADLIIGISSNGKTDLWWLEIIVGVIEGALGIYLLQRPGLAFETFIFFIFLAVLVKGISWFVGAFDRSVGGSTKALRAIAGIIAVLASVVIWRYPVRGSMAFVWVLGLYALVWGAVMIGFSIKAKDGEVK